MRMFSLFAATLISSAFLAAEDFPSTRVANTTLRFPAEAPTFGYMVERAFGGLAFNNPVAIVSAPGETNRLFVVEQIGLISVITNLAQPTRTLFLDINDRVEGGIPNDERGLLGLAFHPGFATNRYFYVFYTGRVRAAGNNLHDKVSRFEVAPDNPDRALPESERVLIEQRDEADNHNGGDLHFGLDGYLYISLGDEGGGNDSFNNSQRIDKDFFSGILRIDVDKREGNLPPNPHAAASTNYFVPADNPFVGAASFNGRAVAPASVRTEFYAVGLRNPWRMSFDRVTGVLYCGDVGQSAREEIDVIVKGGNYGWAFREGTVAGSRSPTPGFVSIPPIFDYSHGNTTNRGRSVTGGVVYRGNRLSQLHGAYVFADYVSGNIWALRPDGTNAVPARWLMAKGSIAAFGIDPSNGDLLLADQAADTIQRLVHSSQVIGEPLPPTLSETGAFEDLVSLKPNPGILPYELNVPFWSDDAAKRRWFSLPMTNQFLGFSRDGPWSFPAGGIWIKHFELPTETGMRRVETRFLVKTTNSVYGATYRWSEDQQSASLAPAAGLDELITVAVGGVLRTQLWRYPAQSECLACHTPMGGHVLGFTTAQLNRDVPFSTGTTNQLAVLEQAGYFDSPIGSVHGFPALADAGDVGSSLEYRVRSYLAVNCAQCHQPGGTGLGAFDARITTPTSAANLLRGTLLDPGDSPENRVIDPGSLAHSMLLTRIATNGAGRMPPLATSVIDTTAVQMLSDWIAEALPFQLSIADWQIAYFGAADAPMAQPEADPDGDGAPNYQEYLTGRNPWSASDAWGIALRRGEFGMQIIFPVLANRGYELQVSTNLLDPAAWGRLEVPGNEPAFPAAPGVGIIEDPDIPSETRFYRLRIFEP